MHLFHLMKSKGVEPTVSNKEVVENYSIFELERVISLMNANDAFTGMKKAELAERMREMNERHYREKAEREENEMKYAKKIQIFEQRSEELKDKWLSRFSPNDKLKIQDYQSTNNSIIEVESLQMQFEEYKIKGQDELDKGGSQI
ncbi:hypothetical protein AgCh_024653 [Apium graveolens]